MTKTELFKELIRRGFDEENVDNGCWGYFYGDFVVYYNCELNKGEVKESITCYFNEGATQGFDADLNNLQGVLDWLDGTKAKPITQYKFRVSFDYTTDDSEEAMDVDKQIKTLERVYGTPYRCSNPTVTLIS